MCNALPKLLCLAALPLGAANLVCQERNSAGTSPFVYEHHNQIDNRPFKLKTVAGMVHDEQGVAIPNTRLGIFTDGDHQLLATTATAEDGTFRFARIPPGLYRLVAKVDGFCAANVRLLIVSQAFSNRILELHMKVAEIDTCSFGELSEKSNPKSH